MDLSTMRIKLDVGSYPDISAMEKDFDLMISNCLAYNNRDTVFYRFATIIKLLFYYKIITNFRAAIKMRDQCAAIFKQAKVDLESSGLGTENTESGQATSSSNEETLASDIDKELESLQVAISLIRLNILLERNYRNSPIATISRLSQNAVIQYEKQYKMRNAFQNFVNTNQFFKRCLYGNST